jgi:hypothetical protein
MIEADRSWLSARNRPGDSRPNSVVLGEPGAWTKAGSPRFSLPLTPGMLSQTKGS